MGFNNTEVKMSLFFLLSKGENGEKSNKCIMFAWTYER